MEDQKEPKQYRYDYFVNKNPRPDEQWPEFRPTPVETPVLEQKPAEQKVISHSQWNSSGTWEERKVSVEKYQAFIDKNPG